jgi:HPt (histidine-containing phosphotransfer) domain-containing protein
MTSPSPSAALGTPAIELDAAALARLRDLDPDGRAGVLPRVLRTFDHSLTQTLAALQRAGESGDLVELRRLAHTLKSSSASIGAVELSAACARLEALAREHRGELAAQALVQLLAAGTLAQVAVRALLLASSQTSPGNG